MSVDLVAGVHQHPAARQPRLACPTDLCQRDLRLGSENDFVRNSYLAPTSAIARPVLRQINIADWPPASLHRDWRSTTSPRPDNCPACQAGRNIAALPRPNIL